MQSRLRTRIALGVCCLALATIPLGSFMARAHTQTYKANLTIHFDRKTQTFEGHVGTSVFCHEDRLVSVYRTDGGSDILVGTSVSDRSGQWGGHSASQRTRSPRTTGPSAQARTTRSTPSSPTTGRGQP